ncbi:MAG: thiamine-phosphate kinase [Candidatus Omnitrophica bacterium]|nr:thiamine-phosphate kinase [Candidatus Omnitrophota bacterium]MBU1871184.1 thiamine-phosphate kinase [Candidatus Omnitrophota bacterium]
MKIKELGEFGFIDLIAKMTKPSSGVIKGIGDDCAVLPFNRSNYLLFTCDMLVEDVDFTSRDKPYLIGRKSLGVCLSDIAACGGTPCYAQVSLGLPEDTSSKRAVELYQGIISQAKQFEVKIVGGDVSRSEKLVINVSLLGLVKHKDLILRKGAREGDVIFVSGSLGGSIYGKHLTFTPRLKEVKYIVNNYKPNSMIDISDGLIQDLSHILKQSNKGAVVFQELVPVSASARKLEEALYMGEDFELLFTLGLSQARRLIKSKKNKQFTAIGSIIDKPRSLVLFNRQGKRINFNPDKMSSVKGYKHF